MVKIDGEWKMSNTITKVLDSFICSGNGWHNSNVDIQDIKLVDESETSTGIKCSPEYCKRIEKLELRFDYKLDAYTINRMMHEDSRIDLLAEKINEIIEILNRKVT